MTRFSAQNEENEEWVEGDWPALGVRGCFPAAFRLVPFAAGTRRGLALVAPRRECLALARLPSPPGAWRDEAARFIDAPGWNGEVAVGPYPIAVGGAAGEQGWLRFRAAGGEELAGLLWVGQVGGDRVTVAYWSGEYATAGYAARYRRILDALRWAPLPTAE